MAKTRRYLPGPIRRIRRRGHIALALFLACSLLVPLPIRHPTLYFGGLWLLALISLPVVSHIAQRRVLTRAYRASFRLCPECEHSLDVNDPARTCPGCARPFDPHELPRNWLGSGWLWERRQHAGLCGRCRYDRRGLAPDATCPECGAPPTRVPGQESQEGRRAPFAPAEQQPSDLKG